MCIDMVDFMFIAKHTYTHKHMSSLRAQEDYVTSFAVLGSTLYQISLTTKYDYFQYNLCSFRTFTAREVEYG